MAIAGIQAKSNEIRFSGDASQLQEALNNAPPGATIVCDRQQTLVISDTLLISQPITLIGLRARLPEGLGKTAMIVVAAKDVVLSDIELHGNYATVKQANRAPMIWLQQGRFDVQRCRFYDGSKDGIMVTPLDGEGDIVGGEIRDIEAFRMARDAVSISGGNTGQRVRIVSRRSAYAADRLFERDPEKRDFIGAFEVKGKMRSQLDLRHYVARGKAWRMSATNWNLVQLKVRLLHIYPPLLMPSVWSLSHASFFSCFLWCYLSAQFLENDLCRWWIADIDGYVCVRPSARSQRSNSHCSGRAQRTRQQPH
jgi:hypothetical protein